MPGPVAVMGSGGVAGLAPVAKAAAAPKLGLGLLVALVVGSIIGSGIFGLPQNMAVAAGPGAILIAWGITGVGMLSLALVFQMLALRKPRLNNGVYAYARAAGGDYLGFNAAWGYWVSAWVGNVGYLVAAFAALGAFVPAFGAGNTPLAVVGASVVLWVVHALVLRGIQGAAVLNAVVTVAKVLPLLLFIAVLALAFKLDTFSTDFWGAPGLGSTLDQVRSTMLVTVWVFIGIEGASVYSARAKSRADVGRATVLGFLITLALLMAVSLLSLGVMSQATLAGLKNPSMAGVLESVVGPWGAMLIYAGVVVSVGGGYLAWMLLAAEALYTPAGDGVMPRALAHQNANGVPDKALWLTSAMVQIGLLLTLAAQASYLALISLSTVMILVPYLLSAIYALMLVRRQEGEPGSFRSGDAALAMLATVYGAWLLYAAGPRYLLFSAVLYAPGALVYIWARREALKPQGVAAANARGSGAAGVFTPAEGLLLALLCGAALVACYAWSMGRLSL